jgi:HNH endonuclease
LASKDRYPVFASWDCWYLPAQLPSLFTELEIADAPPLPHYCGSMNDVQSRDVSCRVSDTIDYCHQAHLVPAKEEDWWSANMRKTGVRKETAPNEILLRSDLHSAFDAGVWVPMAAKDKKAFVCVLRIAESSKQFAPLWHNVTMQPLIGVDRRCLFARVAWTVLSLHYEFLRSRARAKDTTLVRFAIDDATEMPPKWFNRYSRSKTRYPTPGIRPRVEALIERDGGGGGGGTFGGGLGNEGFSTELALSDPTEFRQFWRPTPDKRPRMLGFEEDGRGVIGMDSDTKDFTDDSEYQLCQRGRKRFRTPLSRASDRFSDMSFW